MTFGAFQDDGAALAAVAATGTSPRHILFPAEGETAVASITRLYEYGYFINEHRIDFPSIP